MRAPRPTEAQTLWLRRIAQSPLVKIYTRGEPQPTFTLQNGTVVPANIAVKLIQNGWVKGREFGNRAGFERPNMIYTVLVPPNTRLHAETDERSVGPGYDSRPRASSGGQS